MRIDCLVRQRRREKVALQRRTAKKSTDTVVPSDCEGWRPFLLDGDLILIIMPYSIDPVTACRRYGEDLGAKGRARIRRGSRLWGGAGRCSLSAADVDGKSRR